MSLPELCHSIANRGLRPNRCQLEYARILACTDSRLLRGRFISPTLALSNPSIWTRLIHIVMLTCRVCQACTGAAGTATRRVRAGSTILDYSRCGELGVKL